MIMKINQTEFKPHSRVFRARRMKSRFGSSYDGYQMCVLSNISIRVWAEICAIIGEIRFDSSMNTHSFSRNWSIPRSHYRNWSAGNGI